MEYLSLLKRKSKYTAVYNELLNLKQDNTQNIYISECAHNLSKLITSGLFKEKKQNIIYITSSIYEASRAYEIICDMVGTDFVSFFPVEEFISSELVATSEAFRLARMLTIYNVINDIPQIIVTNTEGITRQLMSKDKLLKSIINIKISDIYTRDKLIEVMNNVA